MAAKDIVDVLVEKADLAVQRPSVIYIIEALKGRAVAVRVSSQHFTRIQQPLRIEVGLSLLYKFDADVQPPARFQHLHDIVEALAMSLRL